jgi:tetratricopeptide (TPR) repeat protein
LWLLVLRRWWSIVLASLLAATAYVALFTTKGTLRAVLALIAYGLVAVVAVAARSVAWGTILRRQRDAFEREDAAALRALARALRPFSSDATLGGLAASIDLNAMLCEERFAEVCALLTEAVGRPMASGQRAVVENALAWATAHAGAPQQAIPIAEAALAHGAQLSTHERALCHGTLGAALVLAKRPADAIVELEKALGAGGTPRAQTIRFFYLGEALRGLGRVEEARAAYNRSMRELSTSRWATRARTARDTLGLVYR